MVVLHHQEIDKLLWGPASRVGRSAKGDAIAVMQLIVVTVLGIWQWWEYDYARAVRVGAYFLAMLLYYRSTGLFLRFMALLSVLSAYGDLVPPIRSIVATHTLAPSHAAHLAVYFIFIINNIKMFAAILQAQKRHPRSGKTTATQRLRQRTAKAKVA